MMDPVDAFKQASATVMKTAGETIVPIPEVEYQTAGETGTRALWYAARHAVHRGTMYSLADMIRCQGCLRHHGHLVNCILRHGLPCPRRKFEQLLSLLQRHEN